MQLFIRTPHDILEHLETVRLAASKTRDWLKAHEGDPMDLLRSMKFERVGFHPIAERALNVIEQINQTSPSRWRSVQLENCSFFIQTLADFISHLVPTRRCLSIL